MNNPIRKKLDENLVILKEVLGAGESFDVIVRTFEIAGKKAGLVFIDGFIKDDLILPILKLMETEREELSVDVIKKITDKRLPYYEINTVQDLDKAVQEVLAGPQLLLVDGVDEGIIIDGRTWLGRSPGRAGTGESHQGTCRWFCGDHAF